MPLHGGGLGWDATTHVTLVLTIDEVRMPWLPGAMHWKVWHKMGVWTTTRAGRPSKRSFCAILFYALPRETKACEPRLKTLPSQVQTRLWAYHMFKNFSYCSHASTSPFPERKKEKTDYITKVAQQVCRKPTCLLSREDHPRWRLADLAWLNLSEFQMLPITEKRRREYQN